MITEHLSEMAGAFYVLRKCPDRVMLYFGMFQKGKTNINGTVLRVYLKCRWGIGYWDINCDH